MSKNNSVYDLTQDAYRSFMHKHLQYYGYYSEESSYYRRVKANEARQWLQREDESEQDQSDSDSSDDDDNNAVPQFLQSSRPAGSDKKSTGSRRRCTIDSGSNGLLTAEEARQLLARYQPARPLPFGTIGPKQAALWPIELEVLAEQRVRHIQNVTDNEPFYVPEDTDASKMAPALSFPAFTPAKTVFHYDPPSPEFFIRSRAGGCANGPSLDIAHVPKGPDDTTLVFESRFESGNLAKAVQLGEFDYELWMRPDLYTKRHTQWFYFRVSNTRAKRTYRFSIVNFYKSDSLYNYGMKPLFYSDKDALNSQVGWRRYGDNIKYYQNTYPINGSSALRSATNEANGAAEQQCYYSLTFTCEFPHDYDTCYFAHCYPYTYSDLQDHLSGIYSDSEKSKFCKMRMLCKTVAENVIYLLTITEPSNENPRLKSSSSAASVGEQQSSVQLLEKKRPVVVITARVHPGESNASWMMKGLIDYLVSDDRYAKLLRSRFIFKIVPMLNPDGVIVGNYRCGLAGRDLNRQYRSNLKEAYPSIWHTKRMVKKLMEEGYEIALYCDLHGHSRRHNVFIYGCSTDLSPSKRFLPHIFPFMLSQNAQSYKSKMGTGRIALWQLGITNSYTMEASFCGSSQGSRAGYHYTTKDYETMASQCFLKTLMEFYDCDKTRSSRIIGELEERAKRLLWDKIEPRADQQLLEQLRSADLTLSQLEKVAGRLSGASGDASSDADSVGEADDLQLQALTFEHLIRKREQSSKNNIKSSTRFHLMVPPTTNTRARECLRMTKIDIGAPRGALYDSAASDSSEEPETDSLPVYVRTALRKQNRRRKGSKKLRDAASSGKAVGSLGAFPTSAAKLNGRGNEVVDERRRSKTSSNADSKATQGQFERQETRSAIEVSSLGFPTRQFHHYGHACMPLRRAIPATRTFQYLSSRQLVQMRLRQPYMNSHGFRGPAIVSLLRSRNETGQDRKTNSSDSAHRNESGSTPSDNDSQRTSTVVHHEDSASAGRQTSPTGKSSINRRQALNIVKELLYPATGAAIADPLVAPMWLPINSLAEGEQTSSLNSANDRDGRNALWKGAPIEFTIGEEEDPNQRKLVRSETMIRSSALKGGSQKLNSKQLTASNDYPVTTNQTSGDARVTESAFEADRDRKKMGQTKSVPIIQRHIKILGVSESAKQSARIQNSQDSNLVQSALDRSILKRSMTEAGSWKLTSAQSANSKK